MKSVFVDTGGFVALLVREDAHHQRALQVFREAEVLRWRLVTTNTVVVETYSTLLARARNGRTAALFFVDQLALSAVRIERVQGKDEVRALALVRAHEDKLYSLCDAESFVVMERLRIKEAIAFDRHFRDYGRFTTLPLSLR